MDYGEGISSWYISIERQSVDLITYKSMYSGRAASAVMWTSLTGRSRIAPASWHDTVTSVRLLTNEFGVRGCISYVLDILSVIKSHAKSMLDLPGQPEKAESAELVLDRHNLKRYKETYYWT
jgi:hypothetical protein